MLSSSDLDSYVQKGLFRVDLIESIELIDLVWWIWLIPLTWPIDIANPLDLHVLNELIDSIHVISVIDAYGLPIVISIWCGWLRMNLITLTHWVDDLFKWLIPLIWLTNPTY